MFIKKSRAAASMTGYAILLGLVSVVAITALENTGGNTDSLFDTAGNKLAAVHTGDSVSGGAEENTPSNIILVEDIMTTINGTPGNDLFIVLGENAGAEGPQKTYSSADLVNTSGGFDVSAEVSLTEVNNRAQSSLNSSAVFNTNGGNDALLVFGNVDMASIDIDAFSSVFLNSGIKIDAANNLDTVKIEGNGSDSYIEFTGSGTVSIGSGVDMSSVQEMILNSGIEVELRQELFDGIQTLSGDGVINIVEGDADLSGKTINGNVIVKDSNPAILTGAGTASDPFIWDTGFKSASCSQYINPSDSSLDYSANAAGSGAYKIRTNGTDRVVMCDMDTLGGGWTLCAHADQARTANFASIPANPDSGHFSFCDAVAASGAMIKMVTIDGALLDTFSNSGPGEWGMASNPGTILSDGSQNSIGPWRISNFQYTVHPVAAQLGNSFNHGSRCNNLDLNVGMLDGRTSGFSGQNNRGVLAWQNGCNSNDHFKDDFAFGVWTK